MEHLINVQPAAWDNLALQIEFAEAMQEELRDMCELVEAGCVWSRELQCS